MLLFFGSGHLTLCATKLASISLPAKQPCRWYHTLYFLVVLQVYFPSEAQLNKSASKVLAKVWARTTSELSLLVQ